MSSEQPTKGNNAAKLWSYVAGAADRPLAATGGGLRAAMEQWRKLVGANDVDWAAEGLLERADDQDARAAS